MVERGRNPGDRGVTRCASGWVASRDMIRVCCASKVSLMTSEAVGRRARKNIVDMAKCARNGAMRAGEWEGSLAMIEDRAGP